MILVLRYADYWIFKHTSGLVEPNLEQGEKVLVHMYPARTSLEVKRDQIEARLYCGENISIPALA